MGGGGGGVVGSEIFNDVVFDERVGGPSIDGKVGVSDGGIGSGEVNVAMVNGLVSALFFEAKEGAYRAEPTAHPLPPTKFPVSPVQVTT